MTRPKTLKHGYHTSAYQAGCLECKERTREARKNRYLRPEVRDYYLKKSQEARNRNVAIRDAMKSHPCMDCKGSFPPECMQYDHRPGETKLFEVSGRLDGAQSETTMRELAKCDLVCANCHAIRTRARRLASRVRGN